MWELDYKESWMPKTWCFWTVVLKKTLESPLDCKEIQSVHPKDQTWVFIGRTDVEAETPILWPPGGKNRLLRKEPDAGKDWRREEKGTTEDEMIGCYYRLNRQEFEQTPGDSEGQGRLGQGRLASCSPWGHSQTWLRDWTATNNPMIAMVYVVTCLHSSMTREAFNNQCTMTADQSEVLWPSI